MPQESLNYTINQEGIATLTFDLKGEKVNKLTTPVMQHLDTLLDEIANDQSIKALKIVSGKKDTFIAGADITEIDAITDESDGEKIVGFGQAIMTKIEDLPVPTLAVIDGACLGGGLELALACSYRIASDNPKTQLGLPEVKLGIIPGFGGTQRLPRLIGLQKGIELIITGKTVSGSSAARLHLVDRCVPQAFLHDWADQILQQALASKKKSWRQRPYRRGSMLEYSFVGRGVIFHTAKKMLIAKTNGLYPAPLAALQVIRKTYGSRLKKGLGREARAFAKLVVSPSAKNLVRLFFVNEALKKTKGVDDTSPAKIRSAGILGAGFMGGGIAWALTNQKIPVRLKDIKWEFIAHAYATAASLFKQGIARRKIKRHEVALNMERLSGSTSFKGFKNIDVIIEAVPEDMELKKQVYQELEAEIRNTAIVASNTSALSITELATAFKNPERFIGMHFFSPVHRMPLVEVIPGEKTSAETIATIMSLAKTLKKTPILVKDCPGFLINRILLPYVSEAIYLLQEGMPMQVVDLLMRQFGMPLGPIELADEVGLAVGYKVCKILEEGYGERMAVPPIFSTLMEDSESRGKASGKGFYKYSGKQKTPNSSVLKTLKTYQRGKTIKLPIPDDARDRLLLIMVSEAIRCLDEGVVENAGFLDMAMIMGTGFPPVHGGLLRYAETRGLPEILSRLDEFTDKFGKRFTAPARLKSLVKQKRAFF